MGDYNYKLLDSNFQIIDELGEFNLQNEGSNYQDLCVSGDYFMNFPLTLSMGIGNFIHMYSISRKAQVSSAQVNIAFEDDVAYEEPESICEVNRRIPRGVHSDIQRPVPGTQTLQNNCPLCFLSHHLWRERNRFPVGYRDPARRRLYCNLHSQ